MIGLHALRRSSNRTVLETISLNDHRSEECDHIELEHLNVHMQCSIAYTPLRRTFDKKPSCR